MPRGYTEVQYGTPSELERLMRGTVTVPLIASSQHAPVYPDGLLDEELVETRQAPGYQLCDGSCMKFGDPAEAHEVMDQIMELKDLLRAQPAIAYDPDFRNLVTRTCECAEMVYDVLAIIDPGAEDMVFDLARQLQLEF